MKEVIEVKRDDLRELYQVLTNYPAISKEQVQNEMHKVFGEDTFKPKDITERVKTFEDACRELGEEHKLVQEWLYWEGNCSEDLAAYLKLRIICAALNEGWEPQFTEDEWRYYPWFWLYTQKEIKDMDEDEKTDRRLMSTGDYQTGYAGLASAYSTYAPSFACDLRFSPLLKERHARRLLRETVHQHLGRLLSYPQVSNNKCLTFKYQQFMETKNNSEFLSKVNAFQNEAQEFIEKSDKRHAVIVIASEPDENGEGSRQTGSILGNEEEAVYALAGFMRQPQGRELLKRAAALSMAESLMKSILNAKEQEERK
nr:MAG: hypothetical protein [Bacteriophage sp.]